MAALSSADWGVLVFAMFLLPITALALHVKGYGWTKKRITRGRAGSGASANHAEAQRIARLVSIAANHGVYRANCLKKALVTQWFLLGKGIYSDLKIGVSSEKNVFSAHAWLEHAGHVLIEPGDIKKRFAAFESH